MIVVCIIAIYKIKNKTNHSTASSMNNLFSNVKISPNFLEEIFWKIPYQSRNATVVVFILVILSHLIERQITKNFGLLQIVLQFRVNSESKADRVLVFLAMSQSFDSWLSGIFIGWYLTIYCHRRRSILNWPEAYRENLDQGNFRSKIRKLWEGSNLKIIFLRLCV